MLANLKSKIKNSTAYIKTRAVLSFCFHYLHKKFLFGIFRFIEEKFFKFLIVGFMNTLFSYFLYALFITVGLSANSALFFQYVIGVLWNFKTTGSIVFKNKNNMLIFKFVGCYILSFITNSILLNLLVRYTNEYVAQAILILPVALLSFMLLKTLVFK